MTIESADELSMWTIYDRPADFPDKIVARRWIMGKSSPLPHATNDIILADKLDRMQFSMSQKGLTWMPRMDGDDDKIVGVWL